MRMTWLSNADPATAWAHVASPDFPAAPARPRRIAVLPVMGFADHGLGLPLDVEEVIGSEILHRAVLAARPALDLQVLPPLRFGVAPYAASAFGVDPDTARDLVLELAAGVRATGGAKLVFFVTSPWQEELIRTAAIDTRVALGLATFVVPLAGIGLDFHPRSGTRGRLQAMGSAWLGMMPQPAPPGRVRDTQFRPGRWDQPPPVSPDAGHDAEAVCDQAAADLARLLADIDAHPPLGQRARPAAVPLPQIPAPRDARVPRIWPVHRPRYLAGLTRDQIEALPEKERAWVILPTGAIEQHGPHLPVGVDALLGQAFLDTALAQLPRDLPVWVAPPLTYGKSNEHADFPGTLSISARTLRQLVLATARQLRAWGFRQLAVLNTHGGNTTVLIYTLREVQTSLDLRAGMIANPFRPDIPEREARFGFHAGEWETALMLAAAPELVRMDRAVCEYPAQLDDPGRLRPEDAPAVFAWMTRDISASGVMGDATAASPEKGQAWLEGASAALAQRLQAMVTGEF